MVNKVEDSDNKKIPLYTKAGWILAWVVMLVLSAMILRNCANSVIYGSKTDSASVERYYEKGKSAASQGLAELPDDPAFENPVLRKAYNKGYRDGVDLDLIMKTENKK